MRIAAVVLAGGEGRRIGGNKPLRVLGGKAFSIARLFRRGSGRIKSPSRFATTRRLPGRVRSPLSMSRLSKALLRA
jgi:molybdopterin-guanine dinucleotide biosynthesis protein A